MENVNRHKLKNEHMFEILLKRYEQGLEEMLMSFEKRPQNIGYSFGETLKVIGYSLVLNKENSEILNLFKIANELGKANFISTCEMDVSPEIILADKQYSYSKKSSTAYRDVITWQNAFYLSTILRDRNGIDLLSSIPLKMMETADVKGEDFDFAMVRFLKGLFNSEENIGELLIEAMVKTEVNNFSKSRHDYILKLKLPELILYRCILTSDKEDFTDKLLSGLKNHQSYWGDSNNAFNSKGWYSLPLLAACSIAFERNQFKFKINSDYIPEWVIKGDNLNG